MKKIFILSFFVLLLAAVFLISGCSQKTVTTTTEPKLVAQDVQQIQINTQETSQPSANSTAAEAKPDKATG